MALVSLPEGFEKSDFPFLDKAGDWGPGCENEADCEIEFLSYPSTSNPAYDKDGERGPYALFVIKVVRAGERNIQVDWYMEGSNRLYRTLGKLGVAIGDDGSFDTSDVDGMKVIVVAGEPNKNRDGEPAFSKIKDLQGI